MSPQTAELGLYWKNMWYLPRQKMGPLGSFIQFLAGRRWNWGRRGSEASARGAPESLGLSRDSHSDEGEAIVVAATPVVSLLRKRRRETVLVSLWDVRRGTAQNRPALRFPVT